jgi:DNA-binding MarR family transcriptional regulator
LLSEVLIMQSFKPSLPARCVLAEIEKVTPDADGWIIPDTDNIGRVLGLHPAGIRTHIRTLHAAGYLERRRRTGAPSDRVLEVKVLRSA